METAPYTILKRDRGAYQVFDSANNMISEAPYVSRGRARQIVIEHKLQDKALSDPRILEQAQYVTSFGNYEDWLYQTLIRFDADELRLLIRRPKRLKELSDAVTARLQKSLKNPSNLTDLELFEQAVAPAIAYLHKNHHPHVSILVTAAGAELLEGLLATKQD